MQSQIVHTDTIAKDIMAMSYQVPVGTWISSLKLIVNNYGWVNKDDTIILRAVWEQWWQYNSWTLEWIATWIAVTDEEKDQRQIFRWVLKDYERYIEDQLFLWSWDQIRVYSTHWYCNLMMFWSMDPQEDIVDTLKWKVVDWTATTADKEKLALLTWGIYVVQNNTNNCSCP